MTFIARLDQFNQDGTLVCELDKQQILLVRHGQQVFAYSNACPHLGIPLDSAGQKVRAVDDYHIVCSMHGALFEPGSGYCVAGPCAGRSLTALAVRIENDAVYLD